MLLFDLVENALFIFLWGGLFLFVHFTKLTGEAEYAGFFLKKETRESNMILKRQGELCANCLSCFKKDKRTKKKNLKKKKEENYPEHVFDLNRDGFLSIFLWMLMIILNITMTIIQILCTVFINCFSSFPVTSFSNLMLIIVF